MGLYEFAILGNVSPEKSQHLTITIGKLISEFGLSIGTDVKVYDLESFRSRNKFSAFAAVYFGGKENNIEKKELSELSKNVPVIPVVESLEQFTKLIPEELQPLNGFCLKKEDSEMEELATLLLECVGLLRRQRRVFVSYRRTESRNTALQLHDTLISKGFEVFLDTHNIRPGEPFQEVLWHKLCDSDVLVMLDTPAYFDSRWTREELGRARAKEIQILRVIWPNHTPNKMTDLSETVYLTKEDLEAHDGPISLGKLNEIVLNIERIRSSSIAARYMSITGRLRADVERIGASFEGIGAHRAIGIRLLDDRKVWAYPVIGIPTAETLNDIATKAKSNDQEEIPILVYDDIGIRRVWSDHLQWLDENIKSVKGLKISEASWALAGWEV